MNRIDKNFCILDGTPCIHCDKCECMPVVNQSKDWVNKVLISIIFALLFFILLLPIASLGYDIVSNIGESQIVDTDDSNYIESPMNNYDTYDNNYQNYPPPKRYYDTEFYVYDYPNNPATCGGGNCPTSQFAYS